MVTFSHDVVVKFKDGSAASAMADGEEPTLWIKPIMIIDCSSNAKNTQYTNRYGMASAFSGLFDVVVVAAAAAAEGGDSSSPVAVTTLLLWSG
jgi:hypothetical protein